MGADAVDAKVLRYWREFLRANGLVPPKGMSAPDCTCELTPEEMEAAASPWHRAGCPEDAYEKALKRWAFAFAIPRDRLREEAQRA